METNQDKPFQPIRFLAAMATGGLATAPFLIGRSFEGTSVWGHIAAGTSLTFSLVHYALVVAMFVQGYRWLTGPGLAKFRSDWTKSPQILMPLGALAMAINVWVGPVRGLVPVIEHWEAVWQPVLVVGWTALAATALLWTFDLVAQLYREEVDTTRIGFVWLFPSLALGLVAVSGAALTESAKAGWAAHLPGLGSAIVALMGLFLLFILLPLVVRNQFGAKGLPAQGGSYSIMNLVPTMALYGIAFFHWAPYSKHWLGLDVSVASRFAILFTWAFATGYALFGVRLLSRTIGSDFQAKVYVGNQWALSCVPVAWSVLVSLLQVALFPSPFLTGLAIVSYGFTIPVALLLGLRLARCVGWLGTAQVRCS